ncbi:MAG: hypothetical protein ABL957_08765 [Parvularculaceae bacterium]
MRFFIVLAASTLLAATTAEASMVATQTVEKEVVVIDKDGKEKVLRKKAERVKPGESVIYTLKYKNEEQKAAEGLILVMPIPRDVTYVEGSVAGALSNVTFSADGGQTYVARGRLTVTQDGEERAATNGDITHVKWSLSGAVPPKGAGEVSFRGVLK